jgi:hypothetical protein
MKPGYCKQCPKHDACKEICKRVEADLARGPTLRTDEHYKNQQMFEKNNVIYEHQLTKDDRLKYNELTGSLPYKITRIAKWQ